MIRLGVTGTDTGVGKTVITCALIAALRERTNRVAAMKPVESGGTLDAEQLWRATGAVHSMRMVCPVSLADPVAPLLAARRSNTRVDLTVIDQAFAQLSAQSDAIVVEGAGGLLVPITEAESFATLFSRWDLDLIIVAANRLGVLNHTMLTVRVAREHGLSVRAVVLNTISGLPPGIAETTNFEMLRELLPDVRIVPYAFAGDCDVMPKLSLTSLGFDHAL